MISDRPRIVLLMARGKDAGNEEGGMLEVDPGLRNPCNLSLVERASRRKT
jgi:hypothetical protein